MSCTKKSQPKTTTHNILDSALIKNKKEQNGDYRKYQVDQANLIRNLKDKLLLILLSKSRKIQEKIVKN